MNPTKLNRLNRFSRIPQVFVRRLGLSLLAIILSACNNSESMMEDYLKRLSRVLSQPIPTSEATIPLPAYPNKSVLSISVDEDSLSLIDAWNLNHCEIFLLIGERNSVLGKVSEPELRLDYEWRLLKALPDCIGDARTSDELSDTLEAIRQNKQKNFNKYVWLATFANPDFAHQFSLSERTINAPEQMDSPLYGETISQVRIWSLNPKEGPSDSFLAMTKQTSQFSLGGSVLLSQRLAIQTLNTANTMLEKSTQERALCPKGIILKELEYAKNVMVSRFIGTIQPWLVEVSDGRANSFEVTEELLKSLPTEGLPVNVIREYLQEASKVNDLYIASVRQHTQRWQKLFEACGERATPQ